MYTMGAMGGREDPTVAALVEEARKGDPQALSKLYNKFEHEMYLTAFRVLDNTAEAKDVRQESFIYAFENISKFPSNGRFDKWLRRIVYKKSIDSLRRRKSYVSEDTLEYTAAEVHSEDEIAFGYTMPELLRSVQRLSDIHRTVINLYLLEGMNIEEIAKMMEISDTRVRILFKEAKNELSSILKELYPTTIEDLKAQSRSRRLTALEKFSLAKKGVTKVELEQFKEEAELDYETLAQSLSIARATLLNLKGDQKFKLAASEKIIGLIDIYSNGYEVFGDKAGFNKWMLTPNKAINGQKPIDLVSNQFGREEVKDIIGRIEHGIYS